MLYRRLSQFFQELQQFMEREAEAVERFSGDVEKLKEKGEVTEETETVGDIVTKRIHFRSFDGGTEVHRTVSYNKEYEVYGRMRELRRQIQRLLREDKFEEAIPLRDELRQLQEAHPEKQLSYKKQ